MKAGGTPHHPPTLLPVPTALPLSQLVCATDLENDFLNPFDYSSKMNRFVVSAP